MFLRRFDCQYSQLNLFSQFLSIMNSLFYQKRLIPCHKKKSRRKDLPDLRHPVVLIKRPNRNMASQSDNLKILPYYPLLSNVLISKKIVAPQPSKLESLLQQGSNSRLFHNFRLREHLSTSIHKKHSKLIAKTQQSRCNTCISSSLKEERKSVQSQLKPDGVNCELQGLKVGQQVTFLVAGENNNQELVRKLLKRREGWRQISKGEGLPSFKWIFFKSTHNYKKMSKYGRKRMVNHFEFNHQICTKDALIKNLQLYCQTRKIELFGLTPATFVLDFDSEYCQFNLKQFVSFFQKHDPRLVRPQYSSWQLILRLECYMARQNPDIKKKASSFCKPFPCNSYFTEGNYMWLLKPTGLNRGRGIEIFSSLDELQKKLLHYFQLMNRRKSKYIEKILQKRQYNFKSSGGADLTANEKEAQSSCEDRESKQHANDSSDDTVEAQKNEASPNVQSFKGEPYYLEACSFVIQKYIERPLLINNRKFDVRVWALLTHKMQLYFYHKGYIRMSGQAYCLSQSMNNPFVHFTNNAIQKQAANYGEFEDGNQLPFESLANQIPEAEVSTIWNRIKELTHMVFSSVKLKINYYKREHCFELFGLDFMIDSDRKVWLIEVNENPCLECSSPLLAGMIPQMVNGVLQRTADCIFKGQQDDEVKSGSDRKGWQLLGQLTANCLYRQGP